MDDDRAKNDLEERIKTLEEENLFLKELMVQSEEEYQNEILKLKQEISRINNNAETKNTNKDENKTTEKQTRMDRNKIQELEECIRKIKKDLKEAIADREDYLSRLVKIITSSAQRRTRNEDKMNTNSPRKPKYQYPNNIRQQKIEKTYKIPAGKAGLIIGRKGTNLRKWTQEQAVQIHVTRSKYPIAIVSGKEGNVDNVIELMEEKVAHAQERTNWGREIQRRGTNEHKGYPKLWQTGRYAPLLREEPQLQEKRHEH
jgi:chromosome segregation ATPase